MSYNPEQGRWLEADPVGYADGVNRYQFVQSSPLKFTDPLGLASTAPGSPTTKPGDQPWVIDVKSPDVDWGSLLAGNDMIDGSLCGTVKIDKIEDLKVNATVGGGPLSPIIREYLRKTYGVTFDENGAITGGADAVVQGMADGQAYEYSCPKCATCENKKHYEGWYTVTVNVDIRFTGKVPPFGPTYTASKITGTATARVKLSGDIGTCKRK